GIGDVAARHFSVLWIGFERNHAAVVRQRTGEPDGAVGAKGSDFENVTRAHTAGEQLQQLPLAGSDSDLRQAGIDAGLAGMVKGRVRRDKLAVDVFVNPGP